MIHCEEQAAIARRRRRGQGDDVQKRAARDELKVALGELSSARQALEGEEVAPGTRETLQQLTDESKRPPRLRDAVPPEIMRHTPRVPFAKESHKFFLKNVRSAKRGAAAGPSGVTLEHLRPLLDSVKVQQLLCKLAQQVAVVCITPTVVEPIRMVRKTNGRVRGIVVGDVLRRVARTMAQQLGPQVEAATAPHQYALSTRAGSECVANFIQGLCELNPNSTVMSIDGISAYDHICRQLAHIAVEAIPFVRMFYDSARLRPVLFGRDHIWPNLIWPSLFGRIRPNRIGQYHIWPKSAFGHFLWTEFGQTAFGHWRGRLTSRARGRYCSSVQGHDATISFALYLQISRPDTQLDTI